MNIKQLPHLKPLLILLLVVGAAIFLLVRTCSLSAGIENNGSISLSTEQIQSIRNIGQWEFLSVSDEELIDTVRRGLFSNDRLSRIYYGTMRIGIDLEKVSEGWIDIQGDTVVLTLPSVGLLDENFIDEARTVSFFEVGKWTAKDREDMYQRARHRMRSHGLSPQNLRIAENHADAQFRQLLHSMGQQHVIIRFE